MREIEKTEVRGSIFGTGAEVHFSNAYSTATQHASFPVAKPWARRVSRVGKKASQAGQGCISS